MLHVDNIRVFRGDKQLDYSLKLKPGACLLLKGPSGCGKSTLLDAIAGFVSIERGQISLGQTRIDTLPANARSLSSQFQTENLFDHLDIETNIKIGLEKEQLKEKDIQYQMTQILSELGLEDVNSKYPSELSGGMRQRVALARNLMRKKPLILLDEPFSALDDVNRDKAINAINTVRTKFQRSFLIAAHQLPENCDWPIYNLENKTA